MPTVPTPITMTRIYSLPNRCIRQTLQAIRVAMREHPLLLLHHKFSNRPIPAFALLLSRQPPSFAETLDHLV